MTADEESDQTVATGSSVSPFRPAGSARRFVRDVRGVAAIEFAMLALPFFMLVFAILETGLVFMAETTLERGVESVARDVRTGVFRADRLEEDEFRERICDGVGFLLDCSKLKVDLAVYAEFDDVEGAPPTKPDGSSDFSGFGYDRPGPDQVVALRVVYDWPLTLDFIRKAYGNSAGDFEMMAMAAFKTESF